MSTASSQVRVREQKRTLRPSAEQRPIVKETRRKNHPACKIVAVTLPPALESAFMVNLMAATGVAKAAYVGVEEPLVVETVTPELPSVGFG
jgi:hypothetical protein